jgi:hypothetical protein
MSGVYPNEASRQTLSKCTIGTLLYDLFESAIMFIIYSFSHMFADKAGAYQNEASYRTLLCQKIGILSYDLFESAIMI